MYSLGSSQPSPDASYSEWLSSDDPGRQAWLVGKPLRTPLSAGCLLAAAKILQIYTAPSCPWILSAAIGTASPAWTFNGGRAACAPRRPAPAPHTGGSASPPRHSADRAACTRRWGPRRAAR